MTLFNIVLSNHDMSNLFDLIILASYDSFPRIFQGDVFGMLNFEPWGHLKN